MKFVLTGPKCSGKSAIGEILANKLDIPFYESDNLIEQEYKNETNSPLTCRGICEYEGEDVFRKYEIKAIENLSAKDWCVISTGGSTLMNKNSRISFRINSILILIYAKIPILLERIKQKNIPNYLKDKTALDLYASRASTIIDIVKPFTDIELDSSNLTITETLDLILNQILLEICIRSKDVKLIEKIMCSNSIIDNASLIKEHIKSAGMMTSSNIDDKIRKVKEKLLSV